MTENLKGSTIAIALVQKAFLTGSFTAVS